MKKPPGETILVVEDEPSVRELISTALRRVGYRVLEASNGQEALDIFDDTVDLLLTDMRLPHISGQSVIDQLLVRRQTLMILSISGYPGHGPAENQGIPFLMKPFSRDTLLKKLRAILDR